MEPAKNLHARIPAPLLKEAEREAAARRVSIDDLTSDAVKRYLDELAWQDLYAYGERKARELGIMEEDVDRIIHEFREEEAQRANAEAKR